MPPIPEILVASEPLIVPELSSSKHPSPSETDEPSSGSKKSHTEKTSGLSNIVLLLEPLDPQTKVSSAESSHVPHIEDNGMLMEKMIYLMQLVMTLEVLTLSKEEVGEEHDHIEEPEHDEECTNDPIQSMGWTDEDLEELHRMAQLEDTQDAMLFITALCKVSLDDPHSHLPEEALARLHNPPH
ncbi:hypothetical protein EDD22DRAFT_960786 [Suillus occidentalis]|nr:hypothetical protein EDD22DRAFT_960786 [Suillus occidentalis]